MRLLLLAGLSCFFLSVAPAQTSPVNAMRDSDHDGLSDAVEDALLAQFVPHFLVSDDDCSLRPARFIPFAGKPAVLDEKGTIYGQAFPRPGGHGEVELHYYHLWRRDCGEMSHDLDAEHVSALVARENGSDWKALYWYAAAHENTVCDASQIASADTVDGEEHGARVWISRGKHASFLDPAICRGGCGGDNCRAVEPLVIASLINLGEPSRAMNGATWAASPRWPLAQKMRHSDFGNDRIDRADDANFPGIAWANPRKRQMRGAILGGNAAFGGTTAGLHATGTALDQAGSNTVNGVSQASFGTGSALAKASHGTTKALRATARKLGLGN